MLVGAIVCIPGLALRAVASGYVQKNEQLAIGGPYAYTRNPLYLGSLILASGFAVAARSWWIALASALIFFAVYLPVIHSEEAFLRSRFPEFEEYARRVPRFVPRLIGTNAATGAFSRNLYWQHREYNALLGAGAMMAALAAKLLWFSR